MTTETVATGWALIAGALLILVGAAIVAYVRSNHAERRATQADRVARIVRVSQAAVVTPADASGIDQLWLELLATPRIPAQRHGDQS